MNYTFKTILIPICLVFILGSQIFNYFKNQQEFQIFMISFVVFMIPGAIKGLKPEYNNSKLENILFIIGVSILLIGIYLEFII